MAKVLSITSGKPCFMRDLGDGLDIEHVAARVADSLAIEHSRLGRDRFAEVFGIVRLDKSEVVAKPAEASTSNCVKVPP